MNGDQEQFLKAELFSLTLMATVQRAGVYSHGSRQNERKKFQDSLRSRLEKIVESYANQVTEEAHIRNIVELSVSLTSAHAKALENGRFRIGTAQKALNLYLKYFWCLGKIPSPPHCPFDRRIIKNLPNYTGPSWTKLDLEEDYRALVHAAKAEAQDSSLAAWELRTYNNAQTRADRTRSKEGHRSPGRRQKIHADEERYCPLSETGFRRRCFLHDDDRLVCPAHRVSRARRSR